MPKSKFLFQLFEDRNSCIEQEVPLAQSVEQAQEIARKLSLKYHHVNVCEQPDDERGKYGHWEEYEKGEAVSWSYPNGLNGFDETCAICEGRTGELHQH